MRKPVTKSTARNLSNALTSEIWYKCIVAFNGEVENKYAQICEMYLVEILKLGTAELDFILKCHDKKIHTRTPGVRDAIATELLERAMMKVKIEPNLDNFFEFMEGYKDGQNNKDEDTAEDEEGYWQP